MPKETETPTEKQTPTSTPPRQEQALPKATPSFAGLDEDLTAAIAKRQPEPPAKPPEAPPEEPEQEQPATPKEAPKTEEEDYLMGPVGKLEEAKSKSKSPTVQKEEQPEPTGPLKAPELRKEYARVKGRVAELEKELADVKNQAKSSVDDAERKTFADEISHLKKQLDEAHKVIKTVAYEQTDEYKQKYEQPFVDAWEESVNTTARLTVQDEEGNTRKGTAADFERIMAITDDEQAATLAQEMFGQNAFFILSQRRDLLRLNHQRVRALEQYRSNFTERQKAEAENAKKQAEEIEAQRIKNTVLFKRLNAQAAEKHPEIFAPIDGDDEGNALLARGYEDADLMFGGANLPNDKRVALDSAIRNRAAAFFRLVHQLRSKDAQIDQLQKELDEIKGSTPGDGQVSRDEGAQGKRRLSADEEIEAAAKQWY